MPDQRTARRETDAKAHTPFVVSLSIEDPQLGEKAYASWADAIILDFVRKAAGTGRKT